jgi:hypothetical protein
MRTLTTACLLLLLGVLAAPLSAQEESYELPEYSDDQRWNRASTLFMAVLVGDLAKQKAAGVSGAEAGQASGELFGPPNGWNNSNTPMRLFRGMYRNWMIHPEQTCELLEATEDVVRARCNRPWLSYFGDDGVAFGVTVQDYTDSGQAFAATIADKHDMDWEQRVEGDDFMITVRQR